MAKHIHPHRPHTTHLMRKGSQKAKAPETKPTTCSPKSAPETTYQIIDEPPVDSKKLMDALISKNNIIKPDEKLQSAIMASTSTMTSGDESGLNDEQAAQLQAKLQETSLSPEQQASLLAAAQSSYGDYKEAVLALGLSDTETAALLGFWEASTDSATPATESTRPAEETTSDSSTAVSRAGSSSPEGELTRADSITSSSRTKEDKDATTEGSAALSGVTRSSDAVSRAGSSSHEGELTRADSITSSSRTKEDKDATTEGSAALSGVTRSSDAVSRAGSSSPEGELTRADSITSSSRTKEDKDATTEGSATLSRVTRSSDAVSRAGSSSPEGELTRADSITGSRRTPTPTTVPMRGPLTGVPLADLVAGLANLTRSDSGTRLLSTDEVNTLEHTALAPAPPSGYQQFINKVKNLGTLTPDEVGQVLALWPTCAPGSDPSETPALSSQFVSTLNAAISRLFRNSPHATVERSQQGMAFFCQQMRSAGIPIEPETENQLVDALANSSYEEFLTLFSNARTSWNISDGLADNITDLYINTRTADSVRGSVPQASLSTDQQSALTDALTLQRTELNLSDGQADTLVNALDNYENYSAQVNSMVLDSQLKNILLSLWPTNISR